MKLGLISLGCAKNRIDSELFLGMAKHYGLTLTSDIRDADIIVVNTCGFIEPSKKESIDTILEVCEYKNNNVKIIVMGCLVERYYDELVKEIPEVDIYIPIRDYDNIYQVFNKILGVDKKYSFNYQDRILTTSDYSAYLRIGDGCNNRCSYCAIPLIRGNYRSRPFDDIINEAKLLVSKGIKEITLIAQDTTVYGTDLDKYRLEDLLREISKIEGLVWIRTLYLYPDEMTKELIEEIRTNPKVVKYFDIPLQHCSTRLLKLMNRRGNKELIYKHLNYIKDNIPEATIRTTFIVGFPTETDEEFNELCEFTKEIKFDRMGCFTYSDEEDTKASLLDGKIDSKISKVRYRKLMSIQKNISLKKNKELLNKHFNCIIDGYDEERLAYIGRTYMHAPDDVDGHVYIYSPIELNQGDFVEIKIINVDAYDLDAELVDNKFNNNIL